jgi:molybdopterin-guanine dinucleotide biosynthesis protein
MKMKNEQIIEQTNEIADGIIKHHAKDVNLTARDYDDIRLKAIEAAATIVQSQLIVDALQNLELHGTVEDTN